MHTVQVWPFCHAPAAVHVCETFPLQRADPGLHTPPQTPAEQTNGHTAPLLDQWPVLSQT